MIPVPKIKPLPGPRPLDHQLAERGYNSGQLNVLPRVWLLCTKDDSFNHNKGSGPSVLQVIKGFASIAWGPEAAMKAEAAAVASAIRKQAPQLLTLSRY